MPFMHWPMMNGSPWWYKKFELLHPARYLRSLSNCDVRCPNFSFRHTRLSHFFP
jgi:hypothetical protein